MPLEGQLATHQHIEHNAHAATVASAKDMKKKKKERDRCHSPPDVYFGSRVFPFQNEFRGGVGRGAAEGLQHDPRRKVIAQTKVCK